MGESQFDGIGNSKDKLLEFFRTNFEDVVELVGEQRLVEQYFANPRLPLISIKVLPLSVVSLFLSLVIIPFQTLTYSHKVQSISLQRPLCRYW